MHIIVLRWKLKFIMRGVCMHNKVMMYLLHLAQLQKLTRPSPYELLFE